jgi:hypothetical protein
MNGGYGRGRRPGPASITRATDPGVGERPIDEECGFVESWGMRKVFLLSAALIFQASAEATPWTRHVIDGSSKGADGVRLGDVDGDGLPDIVTGWEEGGQVRVMRNPGPARSKEPWPTVTVGKVPAVEDAVFVDLDGDGRLDVVSAAEGGTQSVSVHWAPKDVAEVMNSAAWKSEKLAAVTGMARWMFCEPMEDGADGMGLVIGSKEKGARIGMLRTSGDPRDAEAWSLHTWREAGWTMTLKARDLDGDGRQDLLATDRRGERRGVFWFKNPGKGAGTEPWAAVPISGADEEGEWMFAALADLNGDGREEVIAARRPRNLVIFSTQDQARREWKPITLTTPDWAGTVKAVSAANIDGDGKIQLAVSCEHAKGPLSGVFLVASPMVEPVFTDISGKEGTKFDLVEWLDLDGDGDLDLLTCEEAENLGVVWYENPRSGSD